MDNMECNKMKPVVPKVKKKQVKDEMERLKQAEKKKRRVEKALATSVAIRSELEKKKQRKKEEQQKLDEEGAAIAEAVALRVLLGEDSDVPCKIMLKKDAAFNSWECAGNIDLFKGRKGASFYHQGSAKCSFEGIGWSLMVMDLDMGGVVWETVVGLVHLVYMRGSFEHHILKKGFGAILDSLLVLSQHRLFLHLRLQMMHMTPLSSMEC